MKKIVKPRVPNCLLCRKMCFSLRDVKIKVALAARKYGSERWFYRCPYSSVYHMTKVAPRAQIGRNKSA